MIMQRIALVTGGSRGIGLAIVRQLAADGCAVVILDVNPQDQYPETFASLDQAGIHYLYVQGSISDPNDRESCLNQALARFGRIDILVNNAGIAPKVRADLMDMSEESFDRLISVNTKGTLFMTQTVARQMIRQEPVDGKRGIIVNISSMSAAVVSIGRGEYCISKAGVSMLTQLFAARLAPDGILVYEVRPGIIATDMTSGVKAKYDALFEQGICPIKRWGTPEDVAGAVSIFCSGKLDYTTGQYIDVDGGFHISRL
jgi:3-oxoacyl-[acyl-carrier protein] reductase